MKSPVIGREVRYRVDDSGDKSTWMYQRFGPTDPLVLGDVVRGLVYDVEVRNLGLRGTASAWVALAPHTIEATNREGAAALPPVTVGNVSSRWVTGTAVNYTATDTTANITVTAGSLQIGEKQISYGASSADITDGTAEEVRTVWLYYDDPRLAGGSRTLGVTEDPVASLAASGRVLISELTITFDVAGGGGTGGGGGIGGGGGGSCPWVDAWVVSQRGVIRAGDVIVGDWLRVADPVTGAERWGLVSMSHAAPAECVRVVAESGTALTCSLTAPIGTRDGQVLAPDALGHMLADRGRGHSLCVRVEPAGQLTVQHITCENDFFLAGDAPDAMLAHHNLKVIA